VLTPNTIMSNYAFDNLYPDNHDWSHTFIDDGIGLEIGGTNNVDTIENVSIVGQANEIVAVNIAFNPVANRIYATPFRNGFITVQFGAYNAGGNTTPLTATLYEYNNATVAFEPITGGRYNTNVFGEATTNVRLRWYVNTLWITVQVEGNEFVYGNEEQFSAPREDLLSMLAFENYSDLPFSSSLLALDRNGYYVLHNRYFFTVTNSIPWADALSGVTDDSRLGLAVASKMLDATYFRGYTGLPCAVPHNIYATDMVENTPDGPPISCVAMAYARSPAANGRGKLVALRHINAAGDAAILEIYDSKTRRLEGKSIAIDAADVAAIHTNAGALVEDTGDPLRDYANGAGTFINFFIGDGSDHVGTFLSESANQLNGDYTSTVPIVSGYVPSVSDNHIVGTLTNSSFEHGDVRVNVHATAKEFTFTFPDTLPATRAFTTGASGNTLFLADGIIYVFTSDAGDVTAAKTAARTAAIAAEETDTLAVIPEDGAPVDMGDFMLDTSNIQDDLMVLTSMFKIDVNGVSADLVGANTDARYKLVYDASVMESLVDKNIVEPPMPVFGLGQLAKSSFVAQRAADPENAAQIGTADETVFDLRKCLDDFYSQVIARGKELPLSDLVDHFKAHTMRVLVPNSDVTDVVCGPQHLPTIATGIVGGTPQMPFVSLGVPLGIFMLAQADADGNFSRVRLFRAIPADPFQGAEVPAIHGLGFATAAIDGELEEVLVYGDENFREGVTAALPANLDGYSIDSLSSVTLSTPTMVPFALGGSTLMSSTTNLQIWDRGLVPRGNGGSNATLVISLLSFLVAVAQLAGGAAFERFLYGRNIVQFGPFLQARFAINVPGRAATLAPSQPVFFSPGGRGMRHVGRHVLWR